MNIEHIGWERSAVEEVGDLLLELAAKRARDFAHATVVVPTAESGRRLKEYLAEKVKGGDAKDMEGKTALLMPKVVLVGHLISSEHPRAATAQEEFAAWVEVLSAQVPHEKWPHLFPEKITEKHLFTWAMNAASSLASLHSLLEKYEVTTQGVVKHLNGGFAAPETDLQKWKGVTDNEVLRWNEIQQIFNAVESTLDGWGKVPGWKVRADEVAHLRHHRPGTLLFVACIPEITPQTERYLKAVERRWPGTVTVWVNAPNEEQWRAMFDADHCGRPKVGPWSICEPEPGTLRDEQIYVEGTAVKMAQRAVACAKGVAPEDVVLASCDASFSPYIETEFKRYGWLLHLPEGRTMMNTDALAIPAQLAACCAEPESVAALEPLLRNVVVQRCFAKEDWDGYAFGLVLDKLVKLYFPARTAYLLDLLNVKKHLPALRNAVGKLPGAETEADPEATDELDVIFLDRDRRAEYSFYASDVCRFVQRCREDLPAALKELCDRLHQRCAQDGGSAAVEEDEEEATREAARVAGYGAAVSAFKATLAEFKAFLDRHPLDSRKALAILDYMLAQSGMQVQTRRREHTHADLLGWRELPYSRGGTIILTGFHHGCVPESVAQDSFLPDSVKESLGLPCTKSREARDMFILMSLLMRKNCNVRILLSRMSADGSGSFVSPSSLLLHCSADELVPRVKDKLYREIPVEDDGADHGRVWRLRGGGADEPKAAGMESIALLGPGNDNKFRNMKFSPSDINAFLTCPLRFWMKQILGISTWDIHPDDKVEMEANEFGNMVHHLAEDVARHYPAMKAGLAEDEVKHYARERLEARFAERYGQTRLASLEIQRQRIADLLPAFAHWHFTGLQDGWECYDCEHKVTDWEIPLPDGTVAKLNMRADRIDRKPCEGGYTWRIIDYKTHEYKPWSKHTSTMADEKYFEELMPGFPLLVWKERGRCWTDVQLPLYAHWLKETMQCSEYPAVAYYNMPRKPGRPAAYSEMTEMSAAPGAWENVMQWAKSAMLCMKDGLCLYSAESLGRTSYSAFSAMANLQDPRNLFGNLRNL